MKPPLLSRLISATTAGKMPNCSALPAWHIYGPCACRVLTGSNTGIEDFRGNLGQYYWLIFSVPAMTQRGHTACRVTDGLRGLVRAHPLFSTVAQRVPWRSRN